MRFLFENEILNGVISATNVNSNYPATNIQDNFLELIFKDTGGSSIIKIEWAADIITDCLFYGFHNLIALSAVFKDSTGATLATVTPSTISDIGVEYFTQLTTVRSLEITITGDYVGGLATGKYYQMPDPLADFERQLKDNSYVSQSPSGQTLRNYEKPLKLLSFTFKDLTYKITNEIRDKYISLGKGHAFYADFFEGNRDFFYPLYCIFASEPDDKKNGRRIDYKINLVEAR